MSSIVIRAVQASGIHGGSVLKEHPDYVLIQYPDFFLHFWVMPNGDYEWVMVDDPGVQAGMPKNVRRYFNAVDYGRSTFKPRRPKL